MRNWPQLSLDSSNQSKSTTDSENSRCSKTSQGIMREAERESELTSKEALPLSSEGVATDQESIFAFLEDLDNAMAPKETGWTLENIRRAVRARDHKDSAGKGLDFFSQFDQQLRQHLSEAYLRRKRNRYCGDTPPRTEMPRPLMVSMREVVAQIRAAIAMPVRASVQEKAKMDRLLAIENENHMIDALETMFLPTIPIADEESGSGPQAPRTAITTHSC